ncbi:lipase maturation factor family protein [Streptomyces sp. NPDC097619]|uniref:lipase maturation factor family protein n=1 Tax=Streptomyces sp. NPDC097619 TaxID=3157228 RepID=UPI00332A713A
MEWFTAPPGYGWGLLVFQRTLALVYLTAFLGAALQFRALIGSRGMLPVPRYLAAVPFRRSPSLFHLHYSDRFFAAVCWSGAVLAAAVAAGAADAIPLGAAMALWALLWAAYLSVVDVGQTWYAFGWESLLLEAGFLAVFLGNARIGPPLPVLWLLWWLLFRVEFGAGLIKMRGDPCWRRLTCLDHHHETQPMPGPLSWFFHRLPRPLHRVECAANHVVQLLVPVLLFVPQPVASVAAGLMIVTQLWLVLSGNFAWLNWLTIALAASAVDTTAFGGPGRSAPDPPAWFAVAGCAVTLLVLVRSVGPVRNLFSRRQVMNRSYDPLRLVNSYGAFGSVSRVRHEVVLEGTREDPPRPDGDWREYGFKGKPGPTGRMPRQFAPYHLRLDWLMWFAALSPGYARDWFGPLVTRLLENDPDTLRLLRHNPFPGEPPRYVRARLDRYRFTTWAELRATGRWWHRSPVREYLPPTRLSGRADGT